jgi:hypothetical protein
MRSTTLDRRLQSLGSLIRDFQALRSELQNRRLEQMALLIRDLQALRLATRDMRHEKVKSFLSTFQETHSRFYHERHTSWNVFSVLGVRTDEVKHSSFLAWLLDADGDHGQGPMFLRAFVDLCCLDIPRPVLDRSLVRTEFPGQESIIDILICCRGEFIIYLENKVLAQEGPAQIDREWADMRHLAVAWRVPEGRQFAVFLTPTGRKPKSGDASRWRNVSYQEIAAAFAGLLPEIRSAKVQLLLRDWIETISAFKGGDDHVL